MVAHRALPVTVGGISPHRPDAAVHLTPDKGIHHSPDRTNPRVESVRMGGVYIYLFPPFLGGWAVSLM